MEAPRASLDLSRRGLLGGVAALFGANVAHAALPTVMGQPQALPEQARSLQAWADYNSRLQMRLEDAGGGQFDHPFAQALLERTNSFRASLGLSAYVWDDGLAACARAHAADMAERNYFGHGSPEGFTHLHRTALLSRDRCGKTSENLAWREFQGLTAPQDFETMWEQSPSHRRNLLRPDYASAGYAAVRIGDAYYAAAVYGETTVRFKQPLPLWIDDATAVRNALVSASPAFQHLALTPPFQQPTWIAGATGKMPSLRQGVWQLRPLRPQGLGRFDVVSGPLFFVERLS